MQEKVVFVIGSPRSGSTMLQRMLGSHKDIYTHPEPHIVTPLAHLGFFANVDKAPFDHINSAVALKEYVEELPGKDQDYYNACASYLDVLYGRMLGKSGRKLMLDKTPAYALVLPFLKKVYPKSRYIVLTRHPLAIFTSYANSFFDGDFDEAVKFNDILGRYIPAIASFLRQTEVPFCHVKYEEVVKEPEKYLANMFEFLNLPNQEDAVEYGKHEHTVKSYGDPKANAQTRPTTKSVSAWATQLANDSHALELAKKVIEPIPAEDIAVFGYDKDTLFDQIANAKGIAPKKDKKWKLSPYRLKRKIFMSLRKDIHKKPLGRFLKKIKYYCDVLLRE